MAYWGIAFASGPNYNKAWHLFDPSDLQNTIPYINEIMEQAKLAATHNATTI